MPTWTGDSRIGSSKTTAELAVPRGGRSALRGCIDARNERAGGGAAVVTPFASGAAHPLALAARLGSPGAAAKGEVARPGAALPAHVASGAGAAAAADASLGRAHARPTPRRARAVPLFPEPA